MDHDPSQRANPGDITPASRPDPQPRPGMDQPPPPPARRGPVAAARAMLAAMFASRLARIAALIASLGLALWIYAALTRPDGAQAAALSGAASSLTSGDVAAASRAIDVHAPATFRFGASFLIGFAIGWGTRQVAKLTLLIVGGIAALTALGEKLGITNIDWSAIGSAVSHAAASIRGEAEALGKLISGLVPSAASATLGTLWGFRRR